MIAQSEYGGVRTALVTGAASGIGRALAIALGDAGTAVFVADRQWAQADQVTSEIVARGGRASPVALDVRDREQFAAAVQSIIGSTGRLDYLFNNAGIGVLGQAQHFTGADWSDVIDVNLAGACNGIAAAYPHMVRQQSGHIINMASLAGLVPAPLVSSYTATKFALVGLSRALRIEAARSGVRVSVVCPFIVDTPLLKGGRYGRINADALPVTKGRALLHALSVSPERLASRILIQAGRNRAVIVYPAWARMFWYLDRLSPWLTERAMRAMLRRLMA